MERRGSGFRKIKETYQNAYNYREEVKPQFRSTSSSFFVVLYNLNYNIPIELDLHKQASDGEKTGLDIRKPDSEREKTGLHLQKQDSGDEKTGLHQQKQASGDKKTGLDLQKQASKTGLPSYL